MQMQFHLNGFEPGDPHVFPPSPLALPQTDAYRSRWMS